MALTDEQLDTIAQRHWIGIQKNPLSAHRALANPLESHREFGHAIESAACSERDARIAELEQENAKLKTVPMKYRRMAFNAELQEKIAELERQLAEARKDAERYLWAVSVCESDGFGYWLPEVCLKEGPLPPSKEEADAAIDNAMQKG